MDKKQFNLELQAYNERRKSFFDEAYKKHDEFLLTIKPLLGLRKKSIDDEDVLVSQEVYDAVVAYLGVPRWNGFNLIKRG
jgi:hypothetical protein